MTASQRTVAFRAALVACVLAISYFAFWPQPAPVLEGIGDKGRHFVAFLTLAVLVDLAFPARRFGLAKAASLLAYAVLIEGVQYFLPFREASVLDVFAGATGVAAYAVAAAFMPPALRGA